jgi:peptidoglycan hydrolase CwlO-like protein
MDVKQIILKNVGIVIVACGLFMLGFVFNCSSVDRKDFEQSECFTCAKLSELTKKQPAAAAYILRLCDECAQAAKEARADRKETERIKKEMERLNK